VLILREVIMNIDDVNQKLAELSAKIGLSDQCLTLDELIYYYILARERNLRYMQEIQTLREEGYKRGYSAGLERAANECIKIEDLRKKTMAEVAAMLYDGE
jgi:hypothetical protein